MSATVEKWETMIKFKKKGGGGIFGEWTKVWVEQLRRKQWRSIWDDDFLYYDVERIKQEAAVYDKKWLG